MLHFLGMGLAGGAGMLFGRLGGTGSRLFMSGRGRYGAANRWIKGAGKKFPVLSLAIDGVETTVYGRRYGLADGRTLAPLVDGVGLVGAAGATVALGAPAALGAAAWGTGALIGVGINWSTQAVTGKSVSDRWADAAVNDDLDAINAKSAAGQSLSDADKKKLHELTTFKGTTRAMLKALVPW